MTAVPRIEPPVMPLAADRVRDETQVGLGRVHWMVRDEQAEP